MSSNNTFTDKHLASLAAIMLLAPAVSFMLKEKNIDITADEESYVKSYIRYGYWVLTMLATALIVRGTYTLFFTIPVLYWINYGLMSIVIAMIIIGVFAVINNKTIVHQEIQPGEKTVAHTNPTILIYFIPLYNFYLWYNETLDKNNYRWIKESVLLWSLYIILISIWPTTTVIFLGFIIIAIRCIMLLAGMDILSLSMKQSINKRFHTNIEEFIAYPLSLLIHPLKKLFQKNSTLSQEINTRKHTYSQLEPLTHRRTIISYIVVIGAIGYRGYITRLNSDPTVGANLALLPQILLLGKIIMTISSGKLPKVPLLYSLLGGKRTKPVVNIESQSTQNTHQSS